MIVAHAPGKLFVAGEFAVVEPGQPAVLVAVDRYVTVRLTASGDDGSVDSPGRAARPVTWRVTDGGVCAADPERAFGHVLAAIGVVEQLRAERGLPVRHARLLIESGLDDASGRKYGLGSSAAVTVATVRALGELHALGLSPEQVYRLALLATIRVSPAASGGDVAASTFGGWLRYAAPDRAALLARLDGDPGRGLRRETLTDLLAAPWPGLELTPLPGPRTLRLLVGWTGTPASTDAQVARARATAVDRGAFLAASRSAVDRLTAGLLAGDDDACRAALGTARAALATHAAATGVVIETDLLRSLCDVAQAQGAAAKSSGAGGGDCGLALAPAGADIAAIEAGWREHGIDPLALGVAPRTDDPAREATR